ncbi:hypothetical protein K4V95_002937 [Listeria monocytogenes]|nr:hypothetical protein [Listeria monocytogenes]EHY7829593.1 hypothetical protein [Listeria monocytogenes]
MNPIQQIQEELNDTSIIVVPVFIPGYILKSNYYYISSDLQVWSARKNVKPLKDTELGYYRFALEGKPGEKVSEHILELAKNSFPTPIFMEILTEWSRAK